MLYLYVKGGAAEALQAVISHGIHESDKLVGPFTYQPHGMRKPYLISEFFVRDECLPGIQRWAAEASALPSPQYTPFPLGTLLHFDQDQFIPKR